MAKVLIIHPHDNVAVAIEPVDACETVDLDNLSVKALERIEAGHKIAIGDINKGGAHH
jgi:altronate hydrolase